MLLIQMFVQSSCCHHTLLGGLRMRQTCSCLISTEVCVDGRPAADVSSGANRLRCEHGSRSPGTQTPLESIKLAPRLRRTSPPPARPQLAMLPTVILSLLAVTAVAGEKLPGEVAEQLEETGIDEIAKLGQ